MLPTIYYYKKDSVRLEVIEKAKKSMIEKINSESFAIENVSSHSQSSVIGGLLANLLYDDRVVRGLIVDRSGYIIRSSSKKDEGSRFLAFNQVKMDNKVINVLKNSYLNDPSKFFIYNLINLNSNDRVSSSSKGYFIIEYDVGDQYKNAMNSYNREIGLVVAIFWSTLAITYVFVYLFMIKRIHNIVKFLDNRDQSIERNNFKNEISVIENAIEYYLEKVNDSNVSLNKIVNSLKEANISKIHFMEMVAHELRTSLNCLNGFNEILLNDCKSENKIILHTMRKHINRMNFVLSGALDYFSYQNLKCEKVKFNLELLTKDLLEDIKVGLLDKSNLTIYFDAHFDFQEILFGDADKIRKLLYILMDNAIRYSSEGVIKLRVETSKPTAQNKIKVNIIVCDQGKGFNQLELIDLRYNKEIKFESNHYTRSGGLGIGLSVVRKYLEALEGNFTIETEAQRGTCISCEFFVDQSDDAVLSSNTEIVKQLSNLLVVDDVKDNRDIIRMFMKESNAQILEAENGVDAVEKFISSQFDLILMDLQMPIMDGYTAITQIRELEIRENRRRTPIWVLTAHALDGEREKCEKIGADLLFKKPLDRKAFMRAIREFEI